MAGVYLSVCLSVGCLDLTSERKGHRKPKIGRMEAHHTGNPVTYLEVKVSKDKSPGQLMLTQTNWDDAPYAGRGHYNPKFSLLYLQRL